MASRPSRALLTKPEKRIYQAVRRTVKAMRANASVRAYYQKARINASPMSAYTLACDDLLDWLDQRKG